jgi:hypothetical protein
MTPDGNVLVGTVKTDVVNQRLEFILTLPENCTADVDWNWFVDTDDFDRFMQLFEAGDEHADIDGSGFVDTDDFDAFVAAYEAGC